MWFFLTEEDSVESFVENCKSEDTEVSEVLIKKNNKPIATTENIYDHIVKTIQVGSKPLKIEINGKEYSIESPEVSKEEKVNVGKSKGKVVYQTKDDMKGIPSYQASVLQMSIAKLRS